MMLIRTEEPKDWEQVETLTRKAFYNQYMPGCMEHYLVHTMRSHPDFIPQLDLVAEADGKIVGNIMYTKAKLVAEDGQEKEILTFGPLCVDPACQRQGIGKALMAKSFSLAKEMGYDVIVIFGSPANYVTSGFVSCKKHNICLENGKFPAAMLVKTLANAPLDGRKWFYYDSPVMAVSPADALAYDDTLPPMERKVLPSQEEFFIMSHAFVE